MKNLLLIFIFIPSVCLAGADVKQLYVRAVEKFSTCGNALMPWGSTNWRPDEAERPYVLQAKVNQTKMKSEIDEEFYNEANLQKIFLKLTNNFYNETAELTAQLKQLPPQEHSIIWNNLFRVEKEARLVREKLISDFQLHAEIIKMCYNQLNSSSD